MNFTQIYHGMVGRDFIKAFNDNFTIADECLVDILATMIYKIKSTDIKEFRVIDNVVSYTLEEAPTEGEDTREWTPVDITKWGNISGNIEDQTDLWNILESKAAVETVDTLSNLLSTLNTNFETVRNQVENNVTNIRTNTNDISDILEALTEKVNSTNIKAIRLNNAVFQWSPDGRTWYEQPTITNIPWGHLIGDITTQEDLMAKFTEIQTQFTNLDGTITAIQNDIVSLQNSISGVSNALNSHLDEFRAYKVTVSDSMSLIEDKATEAKSSADAASDELEAHLVDYSNPHHVTKTTVMLGNVDNTSDLDKPLSTAQKNYVDTEIARVQQEITDKSGLVQNSGNINTIFVGDLADYSELDSKIGVLAFVLDADNIVTNCILSSTLYSEFGLYKNGTEMTPTSTTANIKMYNNIPKDNSDYVVKVTVNGTVQSYNVTMNYSADTDVDIDSLVEGGNN